MEARMILLPLKSDLGDISRALGCFVTKGDMGAAPRRFELSSLQSNPLLAGDPKVTLPAPMPTVDTKTNDAGFAESTTEFETKPRTSPAPYLKLVKSDD